MGEETVYQIVQGQIVSQLSPFHTSAQHPSEHIGRQIGLKFLSGDLFLNHPAEFGIIRHDMHASQKAASPLLLHLHLVQNEIQLLPKAPLLLQHISKPVKYTLHLIHQSACHHFFLGIKILIGRALSDPRHLRDGRDADAARLLSLLKQLQHRHIHLPHLGRHLMDILQTGYLVHLCLPLNQYLFLALFFRIRLLRLLLGSFFTSLLRQPFKRLPLGPLPDEAVIDAGDHHQRKQGSVGQTADSHHCHRFRHLRAHVIAEHHGGQRKNRG